MVPSAIVNCVLRSGKMYLDVYWKRKMWNLLSIRYNWKCHLQKHQAFCSGLNTLNLKQTSHLMGKKWFPGCRYNERMKDYHCWVLSVHSFNFSELQERQSYILMTGILWCSEQRAWQNKCLVISTLRPKQNGHYVSDNIFKLIFLGEKFLLMTEILS